MNFIKLSPAENTTILINNYLQNKLYPEVASKVMDYTYLNAEQVGFIEKPQDRESLFRLEMSGGEFCGNGVLAAAALAKHLELTSNNNFKLESSGVNHPLDCYAEQSEQHSYQVRSAMPVDYNYRNWNYKFQGLKLAGRMVQFEGITHLLIEDREFLTDQLIEQLLKELASEIDAEAVGLIIYNKQEGYSIKPCVYVQQTGSLVFERGCGSGTLAMGIHLARKRKESIEIDVKQPGGVIKVKIVASAGKGFIVKEAFLETEVDVTCQGTILI
ncbi:hypothetical protein MWH28_00370 [Natroniella sulfidigena]|uniref:hypothetical protein n=1 Tax=Natroniella sulfidigena TaxID=723921 RepID=UPI00200B5EC8|nr:hypothetical protein [Natroniella sulfidigena]MCK8815820.1 hypothetical protein [Natroniella sulfidigena]